MTINSISLMKQSIIIANPYRYQLPYYFPKSPVLSPNAQTFIYTNPYIKIIETPKNVEKKYKRINPQKIENKENIPPCPPISPKRTYNNKIIYAHHRW